MIATIEQQELDVYLAARNAAFEAGCIARGATFYAVCALTADDMAKYGVYTVEQFKTWTAENEALEDLKEARKNGYYQEAQQ